MHSDFSDLLSTFNAHGVEYLVVGGHALAAHGLIRATKDLDVWVQPSEQNAARVYRALAAFGAPLHDLAEADLATAGLIFQIGIPPVRIDIITVIDGVGFEDAWGERTTARLGNVIVPVLSRQHLIANNRRAGRTQDLADVEWLEANSGNKGSSCRASLESASSVLGPRSTPVGSRRPGGRRRSSPSPQWKSLLPPVAGATLTLGSHSELAMTCTTPSWRCTLPVTARNTAVFSTNAN